LAGLLIAEPDKRIVMCNPAFLGMMRLASEDLSGTYIKDWEELRVLDEMTDDLARGLADETGAITREIVIDGEKPLYLRASVNAVTSGSDKILGLVAVIRDITYFKELEKEKAAFVAMLTHELRSPLGAVDTQFHVVLKGLTGELTHKQRDMFVRMRERVRNVLSMINDLLDLSKIEARQFGEEKLPMDFRPLVEETVEICRAQAAAKNQKLSVVLDPSLPSIRADAGALKHVTANLVNNAIKYTQDGGYIEVFAGIEDGGMVFRVKDNGYGIPKEYQERIFDRFFRVKDERSRMEIGTGLGLPIVKAIVEDHHGEIVCDSEPGRGSTFTVRLPLGEEKI
jgi:signal transduction histidine kinase